MTKDEAVALFDSGQWERWTHSQRCLFQLAEDKLCMPFDVFHDAVEKTLGHPVWTHEFVERDRLLRKACRIAFGGENAGPREESPVDSLKRMRGDIDRGLFVVVV